MDDRIQITFFSFPENVEQLAGFVRMYHPDGAARGRLVEADMAKMFGNSNRLDDRKGLGTCRHDSAHVGNLPFRHAFRSTGYDGKRCFEYLLAALDLRFNHSLTVLDNKAFSEQHTGDTQQFGYHGRNGGSVMVG